MNYQSYTLKNGLRLVHKPLTGNVSYCGFIVNAGTRDESESEFGMAHFVEHMLFKGTQLRRSHHIINRMEVVGGELNAYTNKEETAIYSVFLEEHFQRALELLSDITFHSVFPQHEIEKEIDVILDEIHSYEDNPSELIFDEFENMVFRRSQLGHNILGDENSLKAFDTQKAKTFVSGHYTTNDIVFFSLGKTDFRKVIRLAERYLNDLPNRKNTLGRKEPSPVNPEMKIEKKGTSQAHIMIGGRSYGLHHPKRKVVSLLNNILGGPGMNSRLNISLREKKGYVYNVDSSLTTYSDIGLFSIYFGTDQQNVEKCIKLVDAELKKMREVKLTTNQLSAAKKQLIGQIGVSSDNHESLALALGKSFLHYNHFDNLAETVQKIEGITAMDILEAANDILSPNRLFCSQII